MNTEYPEFKKRGLKIMDEYKNISESVLDINVCDVGYNLFLYIDLFKVPVCLRLHRCLRCEHAIRISYAPFYQRYYIWPGSDVEFNKFQPLYRFIVFHNSSVLQKEKEEENLFRKILEYIELGNNKHSLIGKKYDLK